MWARGLATACFLVRWLIQVGRDFPRWVSSGCTRWRKGASLVPAAWAPPQRPSADRVQILSRHESCVTRWFLSLAPEKTCLFTRLHFPLVKKVFVGPRSEMNMVMSVFFLSRACDESSDFCGVFLLVLTTPLPGRAAIPIFPFHGRGEGVTPCLARRSGVWTTKQQKVKPL